MHFGMYLKNKGAISAEQLVAALEVQMNTLVPIGQLALEEGILTARQIREVLRAQSGAPRIRFGELAVELRFMTRDEVTRLLMIQADRRRPLAEILLWQGVLTPSQLSVELAAYRRAQLNPNGATATIVPRGPEVALTASPAAAV
jgi:hypothetical protein